MSVFETSRFGNIKMANHKNSQVSRLAALALFALVSYGSSGRSQSLSYYNISIEKFALYNSGVNKQKSNL